jgi:penicillin-binding protein 1A
MNGNGGRTGRNGDPRRRPRPRSRRQRQRRFRERAASKRLAVFGVAGFLLAVLGIVAAAAFTGVSAFASSCSLSALDEVAIEQNSFVYAADGSLLGSIPAERNRQPLRLAEMSDWLEKGTVAIEDRRFYDHSGLDFEGIVRAALKNVESGEIVQGGSTITQQLVRNLYISNERSLKRKVKEACLALKLERSWSKDRILETYLNQVYFGSHAYGVEAAAQSYFSKHASELDLAESALLAGLPQAPSLFNPFQRPDEAVRRRNAVLRAMLVGGEIDRAQYDDAVAKPLLLQAGELYTRIREPYFFSFVREQLIAEYGGARVRSGGLRIYTTLDRRFQRLARQAITDTLNEKGDPASAIVSINPRNGAIRAMASVIPGRPNVQFNLAAQGRRQAGSAFKTFVLVEAIRRGINPDSTYYVSAPFHWQPDPQSEAWDVKTYDNSYYGSSSITSSTLRSDNSVFARLTLDLGPASIVDIARAMGIETKLQPVASIGLGSNSVSVLEMASAYATLAAGGIHSEPMAIRKVILPNGKEDGEAGWGRPQRRIVLPDGVASEVTRILAQNLRSGTGTGAYFGRPAAGKTGTTDNHADAWFVGYTPTLVTGVWVGYPNAQIEMGNVHGITVSGGSFPASIWKLFMEPALYSTKPVDFPPPTQAAVWEPFRGQYQYQGYYEEPKEPEPEKKASPKSAADQPVVIVTEPLPALGTPAPEASEPQPPPVATPPADPGVAGE